MDLFHVPFERRVRFTSAKNWVRPAASENYGHIGMKIIFSLIGAKGAVSWTVHPGWYVESSRKEWEGRSYSAFDERHAPDAWDLGYHAYEPQYEGQSTCDCDLLLGGKCYPDGTSLGAKELIESFLAGGDEWLWKHLELCYMSWFEGAPWPKAIPQYEPHPRDR